MRTGDWKCEGRVRVMQRLDGSLHLQQLWHREIDRPGRSDWEGEWRDVPVMREEAVTGRPDDYSTQLKQAAVGLRLFGPSDK